MFWKKRNEVIKQELQKQREENIKELSKIGIHYVSLEEYHSDKEKYLYAIGILPTYKPKKWWRKWR